MKTSKWVNVEREKDGRFRHALRVEIESFFEVSDIPDVINLGQDADNREVFGTIMSGGRIVSFQTGDWLLREPGYVTVLDVFKDAMFCELYRVTEVAK